MVKVFQLDSLNLGTRCDQVKFCRFPEYDSGGTSVLHTPLAAQRLVIIAASAAVVLMHNHPSGDPAPSEADIKVTRDLIRAGQFPKIEVLDHVIMGNPDHRFLREMGYFL